MSPRKVSMPVLSNSLLCTRLKLPRTDWQIVLANCRTRWKTAKRSVYWNSDYHRYRHRFPECSAQSNITPHQPVRQLRQHALLITSQRVAPVRTSPHAVRLALLSHGIPGYRCDIGIVMISKHQTGSQKNQLRMAVPGKTARRPDDCRAIFNRFVYDRYQYIKSP